MGIYMVKEIDTNKPNYKGSLKIKVDNTFFHFETNVLKVKHAIKNPNEKSAGGTY